MAADEELGWSNTEGDWEPPRPVTPSAPAALSAPSPYEGALEQIKLAAAKRAEWSRMDSLRSYGNSLIPWSASVGARSVALETVASYVTTSRFPASMATWEAYQAIKAKVEAVLERGKSRARIKTFNWSYEDKREACADVEEELENEVEAGWSDRDVDELVDEILEEWDEESEDLKRS